MSNHKAKYYTRSNKGTIFDLDGILLTSTECDAKPNKNWIGRVRDYEANLSIEVENTKYNCPYTIPKDFKIGEELVPIENKIYMFINNILSDINDNLEKKKIENEVKSLEAAVLEIPRDRLDDCLQWEMYEDKYVERLILSIKNVTGITSLSKKRFQEYRSLLSGQVKISQKDNKNEFDNTDITSQERLYNVVGFIDTLPTDTEKLSNKVRKYLANEPITEQDLDIIINQFVPSLLKINRDYSQLRTEETIPDDISNHAFNSFLDGGFTGWITMSIFGESVINGIFSTDIDIPGWYIGAGIAFALPYARNLFTRKKVEKDYTLEVDQLINLYKDQLFKSDEDEKSTITRLRDTKLIKPRVSGSLTEIK